MNLINEILDLSKIESGIMAIEPRDALFTEIERDVERNFRQVAESRKLDLASTLDTALFSTLYADPYRLSQVLKNLLSNAFKFTEQGGVSLRIAPATTGWSINNESLNLAAAVIAFAVADTGIGSPEDRQQVK